MNNTVDRIIALYLQLTVSSVLFSSMQIASNFNIRREQT